MGMAVKTVTSTTSRSTDCRFSLPEAIGTVAGREEIVGHAHLDIIYKYASAITIPCRPPYRIRVRL